jgi:hypothetical protein
MGMTLFGESKLASKRFEKLMKSIRKNAARYREEVGIREFVCWRRKMGIRIATSQPAVEDVATQDRETVLLLRQWKTAKTMQRRKRYG